MDGDQTVGALGPAGHPGPTRRPHRRFPGRARRDVAVHVRETTLVDDASKIRTGNGPAGMATLRTLTINALRSARHRGIAVGLREASYEPFTRPLGLLGLS